MKRLNAKPTRSTALGLTLLFLSLLLTGCESSPVLQAVYVPVPVTSNLELLCKPKAPEPPPTMDNGQLQLYASALLDEINECAKQQQAYRQELDRQVKRAKSRTQP